MNDSRCGHGYHPNQCPHRPGHGPCHEPPSSVPSIPLEPAIPTGS
ncbi:MAG: hypothetical protein Q4B63_11725 [Clostridium perfringens]|nr:hypothetical protein [Clostridium perfringens]